MEKERRNQRVCVRKIWMQMVCMSDGPTQGVESLPATWRNWTFEVCLRVLPAGTPVPGAAAFERDRIGAQHARQNTDETFGMHHGDSGSLSWCIYFINVSGILSEEWYSARSVWDLPVIPWSSISSGVPCFFLFLLVLNSIFYLFIYFPVAAGDQNHLDVSNITIFYKCSRSLFLGEKKKQLLL